MGRKPRKIAPGSRFGRVTVIAETDPAIKPNGAKDRRFECRCTCGRVRKVRLKDLMSGDTRSCGICSRQLPKGQSGLNRAFKNYQKNASRDGKEFTLSLEQFRRITSKPCTYCGRPPSGLTRGRQRKNPVAADAGGGHGDYTHSGIDRLDNTRGYTPDNCLPCCKDCNYAKHTKTFHEFKDWIARLTSNLLTQHLTSPKHPPKPTRHK